MSRNKEKISESEEETSGSEDETSKSEMSDTRSLKSKYEKFKDNHDGGVIKGQEKNQPYISPSSSEEDCKTGTNESLEVEGNLYTEKQQEQASDLEVLGEPGRQGWIREVVYSRVLENLVVECFYVTPEDNKGRRTLKSKQEIEAYLAENTQFSMLTTTNFSCSRKLLGLGSGFEVSRMSLSKAKTLKKSYQQFFSIVKGSSPPTVTCNLCQGKFVPYASFSNHMRQLHLPDETCLKCSKDIPSWKFGKHTKVCDGSTDYKVPRASPKDFTQFYTKIEGTSPTLVTCNLCSGKTVNMKCFGNHFRRHHAPKLTCTKCNTEFSDLSIEKHTQCCNVKTELRLPRSSPQGHSQYYTKVEGTIPTLVSCNLCVGKTVKLKSFGDHARRWHKPKQPCSKCNKEISATNIQKHTKRCGGTERCDICKKVFKSKWNIDMHNRLVHSQLKTSCPKCQISMKNIEIRTNVKTRPKCLKDVKHLKSHLKTCGDPSKKFTRAQLMLEAISKSEEKKLTVTGILSYITKNYPNSRISRAAIFVNLHAKKFFVKSQEETCEKEVKQDLKKHQFRKTLGRREDRSLWHINPEHWALMMQQQNEELFHVRGPQVKNELEKCDGNQMMKKPDNDHPVSQETKEVEGSPDLNGYRQEFDDNSETLDLSFSSSCSSEILLL